MQSQDEAPLSVSIPGAGEQASIYVRPHDFDITRERNGRPAWTARIRRLTPLGGLVRLDLDLLDGTSLHVQLTRERSLELNLADGEDVFVTPRDLKFFSESRAFVENYVI
ncbi:MAG: TOBE-like domain-containing protein [Isosphaeraceae bacterium]|nr:TOBE-like domain-containing protein [Isosphaeraceae bacterium]